MVIKNPLCGGPALLLLLPLPLAATGGGHQSSLALIFYKAVNPGLVFPLQPGGFDLEVTDEVELLLLLLVTQLRLPADQLGPRLLQMVLRRGTWATRFETWSSKILVWLLVN